MFIKKLKQLDNNDAKEHIINTYKLLYEQILSSKKIKVSKFSIKMQNNIFPSSL